MIIVKLWGGLGNQLFQYCFGYALSRKYDDDLYFDIDFYNHQPNHVGKRKVQINELFNVSKFRVIERPKQVVLFEKRIVNYAIRVFPGFRCQLPKDVFFIKEKTRKYMAKVPYKSGKINYYDGYWQTYKYFEWCLKDIRNELSIKNSSVKNQLMSEIESICMPNSVSVHVRLGDYQNKRNLPKGYSIDKLNVYYRRSIEYFDRVMVDPKFFFFSDDIEWCRNYFSYVKNSFFVDNKGNDAILKDFCGMALCHNGIVSASTFSWWANFLGNKNNGIVTIPGGNYGNDCFAPPEWVAL